MSFPYSRGYVPKDVRKIDDEYMQRQPPTKSGFGEGRDSLLIGLVSGGMSRSRKRPAAFQDSFLKTLGRNLLTGGGAAAGGILGATFPALGGYGAAVGGSVGGSIGGGISKLVGMGKYDVRVNTVAHAVPEGVSVPAFGNITHATIVRHREYLQDVVVPVSPTTFNLTSIPINPALNSSFPWLSQLASSYDQYQIRGMVFEYKALSSDYASAAGMGSVILATNYDAVDANYADKLHMENSQYCVSDKPSRDIVHCIECDPAVSFSPIKYVRTTAVASGKDPRLYDHGNFQIATMGLSASAGQVIGELWCTYEVALMKPSLQAVIPIPKVDHFSLSNALTTSNYMGPDVSTTVAANSGSSLGGTIKASTYSFPVATTSGNFIIRYSVYGAATTITTAMANTANNNVSGLLIYNQAGTDFASYASPAAGSLANTNTNFSLAVTVTGAAASVTLGTGTLPGTITGGDLWVIDIGNST